MIKEAELKDTLIALAKSCKLSAQTESSLIIEVGALRETVRALDPTFSENFEHRKEEALAQNAQRIADVIQACDQIVRLLETGYVFWIALGILPCYRGIVPS